MTAGVRPSVRDRPAPGGSERTAERGSALILAMLVVVILTLLGLSFLLVAHTENAIAKNETRATQALYVAETGARAVKRWFDYRDGALRFPDPSVVDRTLRVVLDPTDPENAAAAMPADGVIGSYPYYKQGVDLDADGDDDLFAAPYRGDLLHTLMGTRDGPDIRLDDGDPAAAAFLDLFSDSLFAGFPVERGEVEARISRIDVYAPPYVPVGASWVRYGVGTIVVIGRIYETRNGVRRIAAEREVRAVINEAPYWEPYAPLHSCRDASFVPQAGNPITVRWGPIAAAGAVRVTNTPGSFSNLPRSLPRSLPAQPGADSLAPINAGDFADFRDDVLEGAAIEDPWFRILAGGAIWGSPVGVNQPYAQPQPPSSAQDRSNLMQSLAFVPCPEFAYDVWKEIALGGGPEVHYFTYAGSGLFRENGVGPATAFGALTNNRRGIYFFDTVDGVAPNDADADGNFDNLTPALLLSGSWDFEGVLYINALSIKLQAVTGVSVGVAQPGEPYLDLDADGEYDAGEPYANLRYPTTAAGVNTPIVVEAAWPGGAPQRDARGPQIPDVPVSLRGILYTNGRFEATGAAVIYGSVIAREGVTQTPADGTQPTPTIYWDAGISDGWPPLGSVLPRVVITAWDTEN